MRSTWSLGSWRGIPLSLHWTVLLTLPWFYYQTRSAVATAVSFAALSCLLLVHELGHAAVARWRRVEVGSIQLFFLHGLCAHDEPYYEEDDVLIAWGGVAAQFVVLIVAFGAELVLAALAPFAAQLASPVFRVLIDANIVIMAINLIPVAPLDGAKAWRALPMVRAWAKETPWGSGVLRLLRAADRARTRRLEAKSERIATDIIDKLKKGKAERNDK